MPDNRVAKWTGRLNASRNALGLLGLASFLETIIVPIPIELVLVPFMLANRERIWRIATVTTVGCLAGSLIGYGVGYFLFESAGRWVLQNFGYAEAFETFRRMFDAHGFWAVLAIGIVPIPFQVAMLTAGAAGYPLPLFVTAAVIARGIRYYGLALLVICAGPQAVRMWKSHSLLASIVLLAVLAALYFGVRFVQSLL